MAKSLSFQNHGLFSDHFLYARLPELPDWEVGEELTIFRKQLLSLFESKKAVLPTLNEAQTEDEFIKPVFELLGYANSYIVQPHAKTGKKSTRPDYFLFPNSVTKDEAYLKLKKKENYHAKCIGIADAKRWERDLDISKSNEFDTFSNVNPSFQIINYLIGTQQNWGILTNGRLWRLYSMKSHDHLGDYYQVDIAQLLEAPLEKLKYFYLFFSKAALLFQTDGKSFLDKVFEGSNAYAIELEADIKERAYEVVELLCRGFAASFPTEQLTQQMLTEIYDGSLILLYRLLFIFYAEARELLPLNTSAEYRNTYSLRKLTDDIAEKDKRSYEPSDKLADCYHYLHKLFQLIGSGDHVKDVPEYNGGLFNSEQHQFLEKQTISDSFLVRAIRHLAWVMDKKLGRVVSVDYNTLRERHLGSIYEGLLEFKPRIATQDLVIIKDKNSIKYASAKSYPAKDVKYHKSELYLANDKGERKATGSYYTPEYIVNYIVDNTIDPLVKEAQVKVKALKVDVEKKIAKLQKMKKDKQGLEPIKKYDLAMAEERERLLEPYLSLKVLDPAMGSGHFLARATDFLAEAIATDPAIEPPGETTEETELTYYRRRVVESCIYGVDLNPLAVELAKLTLWLGTMAKTKPLSFLNHHLKVGNSLIGAKVDDLDEIPKKKSKRNKPIDLSRAPVQSGQFKWAFNNHLKLLLDSRSLITQIPTETLENVHDKEKWNQDFECHVERFRTLADLWVSTYFGNNISWHEYNTLMQSVQSPDKEWESLIQKKHIQSAMVMRRESNFFHWELEFPEVFFDEMGNSKADAGFDAVIGNPPYDVFTEKALDHLSVAAGCGNLAGHFVARGAEMVRNLGTFGMVLPLSISCGKDFEQLRKYIYARFGLLKASHYSIRPAKLFPEVDQRITILIALESGKQPCQVESSRLYRFREGSQAEVVLNAKLGSGGILKEGYIPRVGDDIGAGIYKRLSVITSSLKDYNSSPTQSQSASLWFHSVGRYWLKAYDFMPYFVRDGDMAVSADLSEIKLQSTEIAKMAIGIINSSLFYFWWMLQCDEFHLLRSQVLSFPLLPSLVDDKSLQNAVSDLMKDYKLKAIRKKINAGNSRIEMDEIHARLSRDYIRVIDKVLATHYELTDKEISYLDTYDEEFRTSEEPES